MRTLLQLVLLVASVGAWASPGLPYFAKTLRTEAVDYFPDLTNKLDYYWACEIPSETNYVTGNLPIHETFSITNGVVNNAVICPGAGDSADITSTYWTNHSWTVCGWFMVNSWQSYDVLMGHYAPGNNSWYFQENPSAGTMDLQYFDVIHNQTLHQFPFSVGVWYFLATGYNPTNNEVWWQMNGGLRSSATLTTTINTVVGQPLECGGHFTGKLDELGVWSRSLTTNEVSSLYNGGEGATYNGARFVIFDQAPWLLVSPSSISCLTNTIQSFSLVAYSSPPPSYQWCTNGVNVVDGIRWSGTATNVLWVTNDSILITNLALTCVISNSSGSITSAPAYLSVLDNPVTNGMVVWWKFDEGSDGSANDSSGNGNTGTLTGSPTWLSGKFGMALRFNGISQWVAKANATLVPVGDADRTFVCWAATATNDSSANHFSMSSGYPNENQSFIVGMIGGRYAVTTAGSANDCVSGVGLNPTTNVWYQQAVTYSAGMETIYVNGSFVTNKNITSTATSDANVYAGKHAAGEYWNGWIDDFRIYNRVLTTNEIEQLYLWKESP